MPKTWSLGTGIKHCRWCFINCHFEEMPSTWDSSGLGERWFGKGQGFGFGFWGLFFFEEDVLKYWWQKHLLSEPLHYCMASDQGAPREGTRSVLWDSRNVTVFSDRTAVPPSLASPTSLHCWSGQLGEAELMGTLQPLQRFVHCHTSGTRA